MNDLTRPSQSLKFNASILWLKLWYGARSVSEAAPTFFGQAATIQNTEDTKNVPIFRQLMSDMSGTKKLKRGPEICDQLASQRLACSPSVTEFLASKHGASLKQRVKVLSEGSEVKAGGTVLYWMCRDKRVQVRPTSPVLLSRLFLNGHAHLNGHLGFFRPFV